MGRNNIERYATKAGRWLIGFKKKPVFANIAVDPPSLATTASGTVAVTVSGATVSRQRKVVMRPSTALETTLKPLSSPITGTNAVTLSVANPSAGTVDGASRTWTVALLKKA